MFSSFRNRFGIPGVISVIALVFAMIGGAYAANEGGTEQGATASAKKALKGPRGPRGPKGATGAAGPAGAAGATGRDGLSGLNGEDGVTGPKGATGAQGIPGPVGPEGSPWTLGGTLPKGASEAGVWAFGPVPKASCAPDCTVTVEAAEGGFSDPLIAPISFTIPLAEGLPMASVHLLKEGAAPTSECPGSVAEPKAVPGHLCVYTQSENAAKNGFVGIADLNGFGNPGASKMGAVVQALLWGEGARAKGTWAVTAP